MQKLNGKGRTSLLKHQNELYDRFDFQGPTFGARARRPEYVSTLSPRFRKFPGKPPQATATASQRSKALYIPIYLLVSVIHVSKNLIGN